MILELLFNGALLIFFIYSYFYIGATTPEPPPGRMASAQWPQIILGILIVLFIINIINVIRTKKETNEKTSFNLDIKSFLTNKLFIAIVIVIIFTYSLDYIGFIPGAIILFLIYSRLLGQEKVSTLILTSIIGVAAFYLLFNVILGITLPRGTGIFREFALFLESL